MEYTLDHVFDFKTDVQTEYDKNRLIALLLDREQIEDCSIDLDDIDSVLRVISSKLSGRQITELINQQGFSCTELE